MSLFKSHFQFSKKQRSGIFLLIAIIITIQCLYFFVDFSNLEDYNVNTEELELFREEEERREFETVLAKKRRKQILRAIEEEDDFQLQSDQSFRPEDLCSIQSTTKFTPTVRSAMAPAASSGAAAAFGAKTA